MRIAVGGSRLFVEVLGPKLAPEGDTMRERPTILALHGGPGVDHTVFRPELDALAEVAQLVYYDHRGNGRSDDGELARWTIDDWADDVVALCEALDLHRPIVLGASFGGIVALAYAARYVEHPSALVLLSTAARLDVDASVAAFARLGGDEAGDVARARHVDPTDENLAEYLRVCFPLYTRRGADPARMARAVRRDDVRAHFSRNEWASFDLRDRLTAISCPTLVVAGTDDPITPPICAEEIADGIGANAKIHVIPNCGHGVLTDAPEIVLALVRELVESPATLFFPRGYSSVGRAPGSHPGGRRFEPG